MTEKAAWAALAGGEVGGSSELQQVSCCSLQPVHRNMIDGR